MFYSIILPTFGRPDDVDEFLKSFTLQEYKDFEIIIIDATFNDTVKNAVDRYASLLNLQYIHEKGLGISDSRNLGVKRSKGEFVLFIDSDCVVPPHYLQVIDNKLKTSKLDAFGGPDTSGPKFTRTQRAINYVMTSFLTSGGIRGKTSRVSKYELRGFNMGISRKAFLETGGYSGMKVAEDIDLSMRLHEAGYKTGLIEEAYVFHKRKTSLYKFYVQMFMYGKARVDLFLRHSGALKITYLLPLFFIVSVVAGFLLIPFNTVVILGIGIASAAYSLAIFIDSAVKNKSIAIGAMSVFAFFEFLFGYGSGLIYNVFRRLVFRRREIERARILKE